jgi:hypothetical protein
VSDSFDQRVLTTYLEEYFGDFLFDTFQPFRFYVGRDGDSMGLPPTGPREVYTRAIDALPLVQSPEVCFVSRVCCAVVHPGFLEPCCVMSKRSLFWVPSTTILSQQLHAVLESTLQSRANSYYDAISTQPQTLNFAPLYRTVGHTALPLRSLGCTPTRTSATTPPPPRRCGQTSSTCSPAWAAQQAASAGRC